ncbi:MAG TPA: alpha-galactosidase [Myxococcota bacterium]|nr:alpha-galactosidase [Myxococcota bacterium]
MSEPGGPAPALREPVGGVLEPVRVFARVREAATGEAGDGVLHEAVLRSGESACGPLRIRLSVEAGGDRAIWRARVRNTGPAPVHVAAVGLGFFWRPPAVAAAAGWRLLRQGFQSWSFAGGAPLDEAGAPPFPSGPWLRGFHHVHFVPPADRAGWHESDGAVVASGTAGAACLAGVLESGRAFGTAFVRREPGGVRVELEQRLERPLAPGASCELEPVQLALGGDAAALLEAFADAHGASARARRFAPFQAGWCSWYHFFHDVTEAAFLRNLEALAGARDELPIHMVQLDDGYQRAIGDWLETNEKFPSGLPALAHAVRDAGFAAGLWTAPFCVVPESRLLPAHPDWLLREAGDGGAPLRGLHHAVWAKDGWVYVLDPTHPAVFVHLERVYRSLFAMGFTYLKLDFLYAAALRATGRDPHATRAERLRRGLEAVRSGAGEHAFLLGCGCPLGPAVGLVDGMRIGPDTGPHWEPLPIARIPGIEPTVPAGRNALRNTLARAWMHRRLWLNDPDCLLVRSKDSQLSRDEVRALAISIAVTGGMAILSDDLPGLDPGERALVRETVELAREVDESEQAGAARALDITGDEIARVVTARAFGDRLLALFNPGDSPARCSVERAAVAAAAPGRLADAPPEPLLGSPPAVESEGRIAVSLPPHGAALYRLRGRPALVVFCDYDGTFAVQDVGSTLARRHAGARRAALWPRLERGELTAWGYNMELLDGLRLPEAELEAFLRTVELDPGARELVAWCEARGIPFRVLSDGFDRNLDRLQELHGVRFAYDANHLRYEHGAWRIAAGHPSDGRCDCGTGVCKRARIEHFRRRHPGVPVVHIGNGRVSDRCAADAADIVFAKDTLADELDARGIGYERFATLHDVVVRLSARIAGG